MIYITDTNVVSELVKAHPSQKVIDWFWEHQGNVYITSVSIEEIYYGLRRMPEGKRKRTLQEAIDAIVRDYKGKTLPLDGFGAYMCAKLRVEAIAAGRNPSLEDLMIAAITQCNDATLATRNVKDFEYLGINIVNPFEET